MDPDIFPSEPDMGVPEYPCPPGVDPHRPLTPGDCVEMLMRPEPSSPTLTTVLHITMRQVLGDNPKVVPALASTPDPEDHVALMGGGAAINAEVAQELGYMLPPAFPVFIPGVFQAELPAEMGMELWMGAPLGTVLMAADDSGPLVRVCEETFTGQHPVWVPLHGSGDLTTSVLSDLLYHRTGDLSGMI